MNKKILLGIILLTILVFLIAFLSFPKIKEAKIKSEIEKSNYCNVDSDCIDAGGKCPFGCYIYVNKNEVEKISKLIDSYKSNCVYGCVNCSTAICEDSRCKEICEEVF